MKRGILFVAVAFSLSTLFVACSDKDDNNSEENFRKIDQIKKGENTQTAVLSTDFTWNGKQMTQVEEIEDNVVVEKTEVSYVNATSQQVSEIKLYSLEQKSIFHKALKAINQYFASLGKEMVLRMRVVPTYSDGKVTRLDIYGEPMDKDLPHFGYFTITYQNDNPVQMSLKVILGPHEIEFMRQHFEWSNGNIVKMYTKMLNEQSMRFMTMDSSVYSYDTKMNVFSALKASPMFEPQISSRNNIITEKSYSLNFTNGLLVFDYETNTTYVYGTDNYPTSATDVTTYADYAKDTYTQVRLFEYKPE